MRIDIFGKQECSMCIEAKKVIKQLAEPVLFVEHDMETIDGLAEGAFFNVAHVPTIIISSGQETSENEPLARWDGVVPTLQDIELALKGNYVAPSRKTRTKNCSGSQCML